MQESSLPRSSLEPDTALNQDKPKVLFVIGEGAEVLDTMVARGKKDMSPWLREFTRMFQEYVRAHS